MSRHPSPKPGRLEKQEHAEANQLYAQVNAVIRDDLPGALTLKEMKESTEKDTTYRSSLNLYDKDT